MGPCPKVNLSVWTRACAEPQGGLAVWVESYLNVACELGGRAVSVRWPWGAFPSTGGRSQHRGGTLRISRGAVGRGAREPALPAGPSPRIGPSGEGCSLLSGGVSSPWTPEILFWNLTGWLSKGEEGGAKILSRTRLRRAFLGWAGPLKPVELSPPVGFTAAFAHARSQDALLRERSEILRPQKKRRETRWKWGYS